MLDLLNLVGDDRLLWVFDDCEASALEYGLVVALIALVIIAGATLAGNGLARSSTTSAAS